MSNLTDDEREALRGVAIAEAFNARARGDHDRERAALDTLALLDREETKQEETR